MIDQECGQEHDGPSRPEDGVRQPAADRIGHVPEDARDGPPLPEEQAEEEAAHEHIGAPFDRGRDRYCVHHLLNPGRAMTLCGTAKSPRSTRSTASAIGRDPRNPESIDFGTIELEARPRSEAARTRRRRPQRDDAAARVSRGGANGVMPACTLRRRGIRGGVESVQPPGHAVMRGRGCATNPGGCVRLLGFFDECETPAQLGPQRCRR